MANKRFRFVSPGIQIQEIDNSFFPKQTPPDGAVIIGRSERGPAMRPVTVNSLSDFVNTFGDAIPGRGSDDADVYRDGNYAGPTYGAYAAQAYLKANVGPVTYIRLLGTERADKDAGAVRAGWTTAASANTNIANNGGAFGLFIFDSGSNGNINVTGTLAAVWYLESGMVALNGTHSRDGSPKIAAGSLINSLSNTKPQFKMDIKNASNAKIGSSITFNFDEDSDLYIRKVFNTNPQLANGDVTQAAQLSTYWLGETYDQQVNSLFPDGDVQGAILGLASGSVGYEDMNGPYLNAKTGYFIAQDLGTAADYVSFNQQQLFRLVSLEQGESIQNKLKVSIEDIKQSQNTDITQYGTFTVTLRHVQDTDAAPMVVERFTGCNLDPNSPNFIARKIGDKYMQWDETERRFREYGDYDNQSTYVRVEMNEDVELGTTNPVLLPFGVLGPTRPHRFQIMSGTTSQIFAYGGVDEADTAFGHAFIKGANAIPLEVTDAVILNVGGGLATHATAKLPFQFTGSVLFPAIRLRNSASDGMSDPRNAYFGIQTTKNATDTTGFDRSYLDMVRPIAYDIDSYTPTYTNTEYSFVFSLDEVVPVGTGNAFYDSGSRAASRSLTSASYTQVLEHGFDRFTAPLHGGFNGLDITEKEPFRNSGLSSKTERSSYAYATLQRAIDTVSDPEMVDMNLIAMPGITESTLTNRLMNVCEDRGDALAIIDPEGGYVPSTENTSTKVTNRGTATSVISNMRTRKPDSSYAAAYYPWVQINDPNSNHLIWVPPSVIMMGTIANSENSTGAPWFAPAGFNRGGLSNGAGGFPVVNVAERLTKQQRDDLYDVNVNPIAKFPREGIVVFGQKTLQLRPSALDRVNVRRMMIYIKKEISRVAASLLFDQNVSATWDRFKAAARPILSDAKARFGISDYRLVLDETTTTPDLIDQNAVYAKIAIKPAKAIEYIFIDFNITNSGASFDD